MKELIRRYAPWPLVRQCRRLFYLPLDLRDTIMRRRPPLTPPRGLSRFVGKGDFVETGETFVRFLIQLAGLKPSDRLLDVGCGIGRMAVPLTRYLNADGGYEGFDVVESGIRWCRKEITRRSPNFRFQAADLFNRQYNPRGSIRASEYRFPYDDRVFDVVFLGSVFTHMLPADMAHYVYEIERVLKSGGRGFITHFILNRDSIERIGRGESSLDFRHALDGCRTIDRHVPERAVAYEENFLRDLYRDAGLRLSEPIRYGSWCGRPEFFSYQDIILSFKP